MTWRTRAHSGDNLATATACHRRTARCVRAHALNFAFMCHWRVGVRHYLFSLCMYSVAHLNLSRQRTACCRAGDNASPRCAARPFASLLRAVRRPYIYIWPAISVFSWRKFQLPWRAARWLEHLPSYTACRYPRARYSAAFWHTALRAHRALLLCRHIFAPLTGALICSFNMSLPSATLLPCLACWRRTLIPISFVLTYILVLDAVHLQPCLLSLLVAAWRAFCRLC